MLSAISGEAVRFEGMVALPRLDAGWIEVSDPRTMEADEADLVLWAIQPSPAFKEGWSEDWRARYRADTDIAVRALDAVCAGAGASTPAASPSVRADAGMNAP